MAVLSLRRRAGSIQSRSAKGMSRDAWPQYAMKRGSTSTLSNSTIFFWPSESCFFPDVCLSLGGLMWLVKFPIGRAMSILGFFCVKAAVDRGLPFCSRLGQHARRSVASSSGQTNGGHWWPFWIDVSWFSMKIYIIFWKMDLQRPLETPRNVRSNPLF